MSEYVTLLGTEDVTRAARQMHEAATEIARAAAEIAGAVRHLQLVLEEDRYARETRA